MQKTWIIAAESSRARIFTVSSPSSPLEELETLAHPESRLHERNMVSDLPGKHADKDGRQRGSGHHAFQEKIEPKDQELIYFAKWLADHLADAHNKGSYKRLIIVAAPAMLGALRQGLPERIQQKVILEVDKNVVTQSPEAIRKQLPAFLPSLD
ncbi:MAG: host attachment protein [Gammaproteobacteria bacterium]|nr:host attachment protein [Gammaproteobacteria bacterium]